MDTIGDDDRIERLRLQALVSFSDACTIPRLTPACPYYRVDAGIPRCDEECRSVLSGLGVDRAARDVAVLGGLVMHGTPLPIEVAAGYTPFDATRQLLLEQGETIGQRSTGTLFLQLRSHAAETPGFRSQPASFFFEVWGELSRRTIPVEKVLSAAIAPAMAASIVRLLSAGMAYDLPDWQKAFKAARAMRPEIAGSYEAWFQDQAAEWLARLLDDDSEGFLNWKAPPVTLLANMPVSLTEDEGQWLWDRFTQAHFDDWDAESPELRTW